MKSVLTLIFMLCLISCSRMTPSGFWMDYESTLITEKENDQGLHGGRLIINWVADKNIDFKLTQIKQFAYENG